MYKSELWLGYLTQASGFLSWLRFEEHLLQVPSIRTALGGIPDSLSDDEDIMNPGDDFENGELVVQRVEQKMQQMRDDICSRAEEMLSKVEEESREATERMAHDVKAKAVQISNAIGETRIGKAFRGPWQMIKMMIMMLDAMAPKLEELFTVVKEKIEEPSLSDVKKVLCYIQDKFIRGALKACNLVDTIIEVVGQEASTLSMLMGESADEIEVGGCCREICSKYPKYEGYAS